MRTIPLHPIDLSVPGLVHAYCNGIFPMASPVDGRIEWYRPTRRGTLPLENLRVSRSLRKRVESDEFRVTIDRDFDAVIRHCATLPRGDRWISDDIVDAYSGLHESRFAHSFEVWHDDEIVGGLYGVSINGGFFGESMFHTATDASKVALVHLVRHLRARNMILLDTQDATPHLQSLGVVETDASEYSAFLGDALSSGATFSDDSPPVSVVSGFVDDEPWFHPILASGDDIEESHFVL